jgi:hypothetical protein
MDPDSQHCFLFWIGACISYIFAVCTRRFWGTISRASQSQPSDDWPGGAESSESPDLFTRRSVVLLSFIVSKRHRFDIGRYRPSILCVIMRGTGACFGPVPPYGTSRTFYNVACNPVVDFFFLLTFIQIAVCREDHYCNFKPCWLGLSRVVNVDPLLFLSDPSPDPWTRTESVNPEVRIQIQEASLLRIRPDLGDPTWTVFGHWQKYVFFEIYQYLCFFLPTH